MLAKVEVGRPRLPVPNSSHGLCGRKAASSDTNIKAQDGCVKVEVDVLDP